MKKPEKQSGLFRLLNKPAVKAVLETVLVVQAAAPIIQMLAAIKTLLS